MGWTSAQKSRLAYEKELLEKYFGSRVSWINPTGNTRLEVSVTCSNEKKYTLRVYIPSNFPNDCPRMVAIPPQRTWFSYYLRKKDGSIDGYTRICHFKASLWTDNNTLYQVVMKGLIWLEAYEAHLRTGKSMDVFLAEMA
ncbi:hypothetical protein P5673_013304 [Acropora cervicornis]|uniref:Uncharacterized protein n=1 Tax=Acropora cervicornis TaxID=6130 RepID=A0AAD9QMB3_ACRCE|nr:hypothetical protein P5673_013304 [Acropora cervicornis]